MDRWQAMKAFVAVVEARSYTVAASQLAISRSHLSKQITALENTFGLRLLNRSTRYVSPTDLGLRYYESCSRLMAEFEEVESNLQSARKLPQGTVKILAPKSLAVLELADAFQRLCKRHPQLELSVFLEDQLLDLVEHGFDIAIRLGNQASSTLISRKLGLVQFLCCATPNYLKRHGTPRSPADLAEHRCFRHLGLAPDSRWKFHDHNGETTVEVRGPLAANSTVLLRECVLRGDGIGLLPSYSVKRDLKKGHLRAILTKYRTHQLPLFVVYPARRHLTTKSRLCIDFLSEWFKARLI
jgi:DNA-binding transcriptional LysR family regulator